MDWWLLLRYVDVLGCAACGLILTTSRFRYWGEWNVKTRDYWWALCGWTFFGAFDAIENVIRNDPAGSSLIIRSLVIALTLRALLRVGDVGSNSAVPRKDLS